MIILKELCETRTYTGTSYTHNHSYGQLILPLHGKLSIKTENYELDLDDKHLFFLPPNCSHSFYSNNTNGFLVVDISKENSFAYLGNIFERELYQVLDERWKVLRYLFQEEIIRSNKNSLSDLMSYASRFLNDEAKTISIQYIHNNFEKPVSLKLLASIENFSESYYIEWFSKKTGVTPNVYIQKLRFEKAKEYLMETDLSIITISMLVG